MKAVILAGGLGTRLKPFTEAIPKPLLPIGEKAVLEIQIEHLKKYGFDEIFLATNYKSDYIRNFFGDGSKYGVKLQISKEKIPLGTVGPVTLLKDELTEPFLLMNGDIISNVNFEKLSSFANYNQSALTITIKKLITPFEFGNILFNGDFVTAIQEKPNFEHFILAGIYIMKPDIFKYIPSNTYFGMDSLINYCLTNKIKVAKYELTEYWLDIGRIGDYEKAQEEIKDKF
jgi:NDP-sugar pyrophosphorylase family protein